MIVAEFWFTLGRSMVGRISLIKCVWWIHDDLVKIWNFDDPGKVRRSGVEPLIMI